MLATAMAVWQPKALEAGLVDDLLAVLVFVFDPHAHHVAAVRAADGADGIGIGHFAEVLRVGQGLLEGWLRP
jgi:hypothetical protein